jgi:histidinol-phosphate aminotransferase
LKEKGVLVRHFDKDRIRQYNRVTIGTPKQMETFLETTKKIMEETP